MSPKEEKFHKLILVHEHYVLNYINNRLGNGDHELAKEIKQNTMEKAWKHFDQLRMESYAKAWLFQIANREIQQYFRKKFHDQKYNHYTGPLVNEDGEEIDIFSLKENESPTDDDETIDAIIAMENAKEVRALIDSLNEPYSTLLRLRYLEGLPIKEIAEVTGMNRNTIGVYIHRGLRKARKLLERSEFDE